MASYYCSDADITDLLPSLSGSQIATEGTRTTKLRIPASTWIDSVYPGTAPFAAVSTAYGWQVNQTDHNSGDSSVTIDAGTNNPVVGDRFRVVGDYQWNDRDIDDNGLVDDSMQYRVTAYSANVLSYEPSAQRIFDNDAPINFGTPSLIRQACTYYALQLAYIILRNNPEDSMAKAGRIQARQMLQMSEGAGSATAKPESTWNKGVATNKLVRA